MTIKKEEPGKFHTVQAERDLEANWEVDLAKKLEEYLFKICSGEITGGEEDTCHFPVNFAEAALLLQGSVQVYSRKVEYLYNLVLHALDFLSNKRQQEQSEGTPILPEESDSHAVSVDENDQFWGLNDVPVEPRNCLDTSTSKDVSLHHFVKPPANLVVLEGDCLDNTGDNGELESYLLATNDLYRDFILLDPRDALSVNDFLEDVTGKGQNSTYRGNSSRKSFQSPTRRSGGTAHKSSHGKNQNTNVNQSPAAGCSFGGNECKLGPESPVSGNVENSHNGFNVNCGHEEPGNMEDLDDDNEDDPWKPLNPHELGSLRVKPFKKAKAFRRNLANSASTKHISITKLFPLAKLHGPISPELTEMWEAHCKILKNSEKSQSPPLYEKLRESLASGRHNVCEIFGHSGDKNEDNAFDDGVPDFGDADDNMQENVFMDEDLPFNHEKHDDFPAHLDNNEELGYADPSSQASLEDLCQSHLDALLANIAETEKQSELAARVSSWKQKIEHNLEEQDSRPPFDIHAYGERILEKISIETHAESAISFADVVTGQEKNEVARTFSALLQLVNNGDVDLDRSGHVGESICYTATNPFHIRPLSHGKRSTKAQLPLVKRGNSPKKACKKGDRNKLRRERSPTFDASLRGRSATMSVQPNSKVSQKLGKIGSVRCTPDGKRRRRSRIVQPLGLHSPGQETR